MPLHADPVKDPIPELYPVLSTVPICPLLSVVIPHVDVYPRFAHCLESVLAELHADVEVIHAKRYSLASLSRTDFTLSRNKARSYLGHGGSLWQQPNLVAVSGGRPRDMLVVVLSVFLIPIAVVLALFAPLVSAMILALVLVLNLPFYSFLARQEGLAFAVIGVFISLVDFVVCSAGALVGALEYAVGRRF